MLSNREAGSSVKDVITQSAAVCSFLFKAASMNSCRKHKKFKLCDTAAAPEAKN